MRSSLQIGVVCPEVSSGPGRPRIGHRVCCRVTNGPNPGVGAEPSIQPAAAAHRPVTRPAHGLRSDRPATRCPAALGATTLPHRRLRLLRRADKEVSDDETVA